MLHGFRRSLLVGSIEILWSAKQSGCSGQYDPSARHNNKNRNADCPMKFQNWTKSILYAVAIGLLRG